jgi:hypothetical protein
MIFFLSQELWIAIASHLLTEWLFLAQIIHIPSTFK